MPLTDLLAPESASPPPAAPPPYRAYRVLPEFLDFVWEKAEPLLERAVARDRGLYSTRDVYGWIKTNEQQLWLVARGREVVVASLMRCQIHPSGKHTATWHLLGAKPGGWAGAWVDTLFQAFLAEARARGSVEMTIVGRRGWQHWARRYGFKPVAVVLLREEAKR